jgi:hypothetical protein
MARQTPSTQSIPCPYCGAINHFDGLSPEELSKYEGNPSTWTRRNGERRGQSQQPLKCQACGKPLPRRD